MNETFDNRSLYMFTNGLEEKDIVESLKEGFQNYEEETGDTIETFLRINIVKDSEGISLNYGWIFVSNPKVYHLLSGNNPDGTERITIIDQEHWVKPEIPYEQRCKETYENERRKYGENDWAHVDLFEQVKEVVKKQYECPKIEKHLPPLIKLKPRVNSEGEMTSISISRGKLIYPTYYYAHHQLRNAPYTKIPSWMSKEFLYKIFRPYVSNPNDMKYPIIRFSDKRNDLHKNERNEIHKNDQRNEEEGFMVFIEYDPNSTDGLVALNMTKKIYLRDMNGNDWTFAFNFAQNKNKP